MELPLLAAVVVGLMGSSHCLGMCGGISAVVVSDQQGADRYLRLLLYNSGRLLTYASLGAAMGLLGQQVVEWQQAGLWALRLLAAFMLIAMGLYISQLWQGLTVLERWGGVLWRRLQPLSRLLLPARAYWQLLALGMLWGLLPCGLVYSTLAWALALADGRHAALLMFCFGLGTLPAMLATGATAQYLWRFRQHLLVRRLSGALLIVMGVLSLALPVLHFNDSHGDQGHHQHNHTGMAAMQPVSIA